MAPDNRHRIVIVGGGSAGWMTAAALAKALPANRHAITVIASSQVPTVAVGEATIPGIHEFNQFLGINETAFLKQTMGTFKLGIEFSDWSEKGARYMHPFGPFGVNLGGVPFHQFYLRYLQEGTGNIDLASLNLEWLTAKKHRFTHPVSDKRSPLGHLKYAYHFDALAYADYLQTYATQRQVKYIDDKVTRVTQNHDGSIAAVELTNNGAIEGDFFIDCSGFNGLLIDKTLGAGYEDWREVLPCDSALTFATPAVNNTPPFTRAIAHQCGWRWQIPLQHRTGNGWVYASRFCSQDNAIQAFASTLGVSPDSDFHSLKWVNGMRKTPWQKNCVAIGLSAGFIEPLESTGLQLIQSAIFRLLSLFPGSEGNHTRASHYNRFAEEEMQTIRDFVVAHYALTTRDDSPFWQYCSAMPVPTSLQTRLALYRESGNLYRGSNELFNEISWFAVLHGQGLKPDTIHPLAWSLPVEELEKHMQGIAHILNKVTDPLPAHQHYLSQYLKP